MRDELNEETLKKLTPLELVLALDILLKIQEKPHEFYEISAQSLHSSWFSCLSDKEFSLLIEAVYEKFLSLRVNTITETENGTEDTLQPFFSPLGRLRDKTGLISSIKLQFFECNSVELLKQTKEKIILLLKNPNLSENQKKPAKNRTVCPYAVGTDLWYVWHHQTPPIKSKGN